MLTYTEETCLIQVAGYNVQTTTKNVCKLQAVTCGCYYRFVADCVAEEQAVVITTPTSGSLLTAGATYTVTWRGGSPISNVALLLMCSDCGDQYTAFTGFGIPSTSIANTQSFSWTMTAGIPSSTTYTLLLVSMSDASNFDISATFSVDGMVTGYTWALGQFGPLCSKPCGGGTWTRSVACYSSSGRAHRKSGEHVASTHVYQCACTITTTVLFPACTVHAT